MEKLTVETQTKGDWHYFVLKGPIVEGVEDWLTKVERLGGMKCVIDLSRITMVNSCGIAEWVDFVQAFSAARTVVFDNVPTHVLRIINMISSFVGNGRIRSVCLGFVCENCEFEQIEQFIMGENMPESSDVSLRRACPKCKNTMLPSMEEREAFAFLNAMGS